MWSEYCRLRGVKYSVAFFFNQLGFMDIRDSLVYIIKVYFNITLKICHD